MPRANTRVPTIFDIACVRIRLRWERFTPTLAWKQSDNRTHFDARFRLGRTQPERALRQARRRRACGRAPAAGFVAGLSLAEERSEKTQHRRTVLAGRTGLEGSRTLGFTQEIRARSRPQLVPRSGRARRCVGARNRRRARCSGSAHVARAANPRSYRWRTLTRRVRGWKQGGHRNTKGAEVSRCIAEIQ
jgi:hypothetical protein